MNLERSNRWVEHRHAARKLMSTIKILFRLGMARTFGTYRHTVWDGRMDYAIYRWRGNLWAIPTDAMTADND